MCLYMSVYVCMYMCACMYVCMYVYRYVYISMLCISQCLYTYIFLSQATEEKAEALIALIDVEKKGTINFDEFCKFIVLLKQGDARSG